MDHTCNHMAQIIAFCFRIFGGCATAPQGLAIAILQFLDRSILILIIFSFVQLQSLLIFYLSPSSTNLRNLVLVVSQSSVLYPFESFHLSL